MDPDPSKPLYGAPLLELASALESIRDSFMLISLVLKDFLAEMPSQEKDDVAAEVGSFLEQIRLKTLNRSD